MREWLAHLRYQRLTRKCRSRTVGRCRHRPLCSGLPVLCHCSPGTVPTSCTTSTAHTRPNVACPHHIYHTGTVTPSVFSQSTSGAVRYRQLLRDGLLHAGHSAHMSGTVPDVRDDDGNENWGPRSSRSAGRRAPRAPTPTGLHGRPSVVLLPPVAWSGVDMMAELGRVAAGRRSGRGRERVV